MKAKIVQLAASLIEDLNTLTSKPPKMEPDVENSRNDSIIAQEPDAYSTVIALERLRKEAEKEEAAVEAGKQRCRVCFKEIAPTRRCFGHGGGGGGGEAGGSASGSEGNTSKNDDNSLIKTDFLGDQNDEFSSMRGGEGLNGDSQLDEENFDPAIIADLIAKGLLVIDNNREAMTLTLKLQCDLDSLSKEQREELKKFMGAIIKEFNTFKEKHQLSNECIHIIQDEEGNILSLSISLPTLKLYDEFIQSLANNLVPAPSPKLPLNDKQMETKSIADERTKNTPSAIQEGGEETFELFNPYPFKMKPLY